MSRLSSRQRSPWVAVLLALPGPLLSMLYLGRPRRAASYLIAGVLGPYAAYQLARHGLWPAGVTWLVLPLAVAAVGIVDAYRIASRPIRRFSGAWFTTWKGLLAVWLGMVLAILVFRDVGFGAYLIPSESMLPTLRENDQIIVEKFAYRSFSIPFTSIELHSGARPRRGDLVIFRPPADASVVHVKRVIGLPGDIVVYDATTKRLRINGEIVEAEYLGYYMDDRERQLVREVFASGEHMLVHTRDRLSLGGTYPVPEDHYFLLGDNRDNSRDSRFRGIEYIPAENIDGKITLIWWNTELPGRAGIVPE